MKLVFLSSPYSGDIERNVKYARACARDCLLRGESPFASHLLFTQEGVLRDEDPADRQLGTRAGIAWMPRADYSVFYTDWGWSAGMQAELDECFNYVNPGKVYGLLFRIRALKGEPTLPPHIPRDHFARIKVSVDRPSLND